jgi:hypothetical protein
MSLLGLRLVDTYRTNCESDCCVQLMNTGSASHWSQHGIVGFRIVQLQEWRRACPLHTLESTSHVGNIEPAKPSILRRVIVVARLNHVV